MPNTSTTARARDPNAADDTAAGSIRRLCLELRGVGAQLLLDVSGAGIPVAGVAVSVDVGAALRSAPSAGRFRQQAFDIMTSGLPVTFGIEGLRPGPCAAARFGQLCELIGSARDEAGGPGASIEFALPADALPPGVASLTRRGSLGDGPVHLLAGSGFMRPRNKSGCRKNYDRFWTGLWKGRCSNTVRPAYAPLVTSHCSLLEAELAGAVMPCIGLQVPQQSAWVPVRIDLCQFTDSRGRLDERSLETALCCCVDVGDALHDQLHWPTARMRQDAWLNRRLAILITGIGDVVVQRGQDPGDLGCLRDFDKLLAWVSAVLRCKSRSIALQVEHLPALDLRDPTRELPPGRLRDGWRERWRNALEVGMTRNRNLLALSPWSLFPTRGPADYRYFDLLPLLAYADTVTFAHPPPIQGWKINKFRQLHQRAWAVLEQKKQLSTVCETGMN